MKTVMVRSLKKADWEKFALHLLQAKWTPPRGWDCYTVEKEASNLAKLIMEAFNKCCPLRPLRIGKSTMTWFDEECKDSRRKVKRAEKNYKNNISQKAL